MVSRTIKLKMLSQPKQKIDSLSVAHFLPVNLLLPYFFKTNLQRRSLTVLQFPGHKHTT